MMLHFAVFAFYVALCVVCITGAEANIRVPFTSASRIQTWLNLISHVRIIISPLIRAQQG